MTEVSAKRGMLMEKDFHVTEAQSIGADAFNLFSIASYGNPDTNVTDTSTFAQIRLFARLR